MRLGLRPALAALVLVLSIPAAAAGQDPSDMAVTPDGRHLHTSGGANETFAIDPATGALTGLAPELGNNGGLDGRLAIAPDGRFVYMGAGIVGIDGSITRQFGSIHRFSREPESGVLTHEQTLFGGPWPGSSGIGHLREIELTGDGRHLYALEDGGVIVFARDGASGDLTRVEGPHRVRAQYDPQSMIDLALSPDERHVYVLGDNAAIGIFARDAESGRLNQVGSGGGAQGDILISPDGRRVYTGGATYVVHKRNPADGALTPAGYFDPKPGSCGDCTGRLLGISPDGTSVFSTSERDGTVVESRATEGGLVRTYDSGPEPAGRIANATAMTWSPDGRFAYIAVEEYHDNQYGPQRFSPSPHWVAAFQQTGDGLVPIGSAQTPPPSTAEPRMEVSPAGSVTINDGALYTNDPDVEITVGAGFGTYAFRLSNVEGAFGTATPLRLANGLHRRPWRLETGPAGQTLPDRSVRRVHLRFVQSGAIAKPDLSDDIVLDMKAPELLSARLERSRLKVKARDNRSGIRRAQVTTDRKKPGKARKFKASLPVSAKSKRVYVRVLDGAGNHSKWRSARRR